MSRSVARAILTSSALFAAATATSIARANETVKYTYDAKGRIVSIQHTGTINNNVVANYTYDTADNRTRVTLSGAPFGALSSSSPSNSCTLGANGLFTLTICWAITSGSPSNVVVKVGDPQAVFAASGAGARLPRRTVDSSVRLNILSLRRFCSHRNVVRAWDKLDHMFA